MNNTCLTFIPIMIATPYAEVEEWETRPTRAERIATATNLLEILTNIPDYYFQTQVTLNLNL